MDTLKAIGAKLTEIPETFKIHRRLGNIIKDKKATLDAGEGIDWGTAEALAFGSSCKKASTFD